MEHYAKLAIGLKEQGIACVAIGTKSEAYLVADLRRLAPDVIDLCGQTSLHQLAGVARRAMAVVGNDTGPTHLAAAVGAPTLALFSGQTNPVWSAPRGPKTTVLQRDPLPDLTPDEVLLALMKLAVSY